MSFGRGGSTPLCGTLKEILRCRVGCYNVFMSDEKWKKGQGCEGEVLIRRVYTRNDKNEFVCCEKN